ncbi:MAG: MFS transporter [Rothia sp. (in: high G+C Gram-positive bacteria)]|uniref:MFS transporter n=1 Tax=Rothia sp. (in: high G+C Gram-positive bacteria) TaxID=1885016 RepID=UPI0026DFE4E1|nr:MFS transporter [Rothia sp. (in: high G+C Gram-positive bacteria)]MDO5750544.1 MFS transporter [Rothia sp. (in: high G+C Gram-positive bacteria)]
MTSLRAIPGSIWALSWASFINRSTGFLGLFAAIFFTYIGVDPTLLALFLLLSGSAGVLGSLAGGAWADRWGAKRILLFSTLLNMAFFIALGTVNYSGHMLVLILASLNSFASQLWVAPASAIVAASAEDQERVTRFAFYRIFMNVGAIVAPVLVAFAGKERFHELFLLSAIASAAVPFLLRYVPKSASSHESHQKSAGARHSLPLILVYLALMVTMLIYAQHQSAIPLVLDPIESGMQLYALLLIINPVIIICVEYPLSFFSKKLAQPLALSLGIAVMTAGVMLTGASVLTSWTWAWAIAGWVLFSIGECLFAPTSHSYVAALADDASQARAQGALSAAQTIGSALGPAVGAALVVGVGAWTWPIFGVLAVAACVCVWLSARVRV